MKRPDPLARIQLAMSGGARSPAYVWFWDNFEKLPHLERRKVNYLEIAQALADLRITTRSGKPLTVDNLRKTLQRVVQDKRAQGQIKPVNALLTQSPASPPLPPQPSALGRTMPSPPEVETDEDEEEPPEPKIIFTTASIRR